MSHSTPRRRATRRRGVLLAGVAAVVSLLAACAPPGPVVIDPDPDRPFVLEGVTAVTQRAQLTGPGAVNDTESVGVAGTDLGSMVNLGDKTFFFFGDTFGERDPASSGASGGMWRSNVSAWTTDSDPADGITFGGWLSDGIGLAAPLIEGEHAGNDSGGEVTKIPTYGFAIGSDMYVSYMSVRHWGDAGAWDANYAAFVKSSDGGRSWHRVEGVQWPGDGDFVQFAAATAVEGGVEYVYLWAIPAGRFGAVRLMRVRADQASVESAGAYEYYAGTQGSEARWSTERSDARPVVEGTIGELSVMWSTYLDRWIMTYSDGGNAYIREGITPWGPWGDPTELVPGGAYPGLYAPYLNPRYVGEGGRRIYFTLSLWDPYNVFWFSADLERK